MQERSNEKLFKYYDDVCIHVQGIVMSVNNFFSELVAFRVSF